MSDQTVMTYASDRDTLIVFDDCPTHDLTGRLSLGVSFSLSVTAHPAVHAWLRQAYPHLRVSDGRWSALGCRVDRVERICQELADLVRPE